jgi:ribosomal protein S12 methylthiotransferase accessory factor YcaO
LLRGLQEVIERDAVVGAWWGSYPLEEWDAGIVFEMMGTEFKGRLERPNLRYRCYRVASPFSAHVTMVTLQGEDREGFCFSVGTACRQTRLESWRKAMLEAVQGRHYVRYLRRVQPRHAGPPLSFADHALYYSLHAERLPDTALAGAAPAHPGPTDEVVDDCAALLDRLGPDRPVLFRNLTPPMVAQEIGDWYVVKVLVPGLLPLHGDSRYPHLGGPLWASRRLAEWDAMPPHPFP